jgi:hypothetical protein
MATLNSSNISNGNTIEPNDLLQLYDALTPGGGTTGVYDISISGSITGSATSASYAATASLLLGSVVSASFASTSSAITTAVTGGGTHYLTFVDQAGTRPPKIASLLEYTTATNNLQVTASRAITSSFAVTASYAANAANSDFVKVTPQGGSLRDMYAIVGYATFTTIGVTSASVDWVANFPTLPIPNGIGNDLFITANPTDDPSPSIRVTWDVGTGDIIFYDSTGAYQGSIVYTGYLQV